MKDIITFIIHLRKDTEERAKNVDIVIPYYRKVVPNSKFIVIEDAAEQSFDHLAQYSDVTYIFNHNPDQHNKCKGYNTGLKASDTDIVCFLDIDCIISKENILKAIQTVNESNSICIGYNGTCVYFNYNVKSLVDKSTENLYDFLTSFVDFDNLSLNYTTDSYKIANTKAVGGALFGKRLQFNNIGGFNPNFKGWGYEDNEIIIRARILQVPLFYIQTNKSLLLHLPHMGESLHNTEMLHKSYRQNEAEYIKISNLSQDELTAYIQSWTN
jgi:predicted glycosyltransferase involved in capsule biosynthesis